MFHILEIITREATLKVNMSWNLGAAHACFFTLNPRCGFTLICHFLLDKINILHPAHTEIPVQSTYRVSGDLINFV